MVLYLLLSNYSSNSIKGFTFDPQKARNLLAEAGYPNGKGFPIDISLLLNSGGERNIEVAEAIQKMLSDNLSISIKLNVLPFPQKLNLENNGQAQFLEIRLGCRLSGSSNFFGYFLIALYLM